LRSTLLLFVLFCFGLAGAQSGVPAKDLARIRRTKLHFLLPSYIPAGFRVAKVELDTNKDPMLVNLSITWKKGKSHFTLQQCSEGIGDLMMSVPNGDTVEPQGTYTFHHKLWPKGPVDYYVKGSTRLWAVNWQELPGKSYPRFVSAIGEGMNAREGVQIMESLRRLK
jgi:hypothetical protein